MSDFLSHECGVALVRLLKPLSHYQEKYGTPLWGFTKLFLLMEKQHNRGQDGAGVACVKLDVPAGDPFMFREIPKVSDAGRDHRDAILRRQVRHSARSRGRRVGHHRQACLTK